jgi:hypothetical protein
MHTKQAAAAQAAGAVKTFAVGHTVKWTSQAAGSWKEKVGAVHKVVPANTLVPPGYGFYGQRSHESYIVHVPTATGRGKGAYYWPIASKLQRVVG